MRNRWCNQNPVFGSDGVGEIMGLKCFMVAEPQGDYMMTACIQKQKWDIKEVSESVKTELSYILFPVLLTSWSAGWQDGHWWVIFIGFLQGQLLGYHGFWKIWWYARPYLLCSFYLPFPAYEYFSSISCGGNSTTRSSIWNCCHKISSLADTVMKILSYSME